MKMLSSSPFVHHQMRIFLTRHTREDLVVLKELVESGEIRPVMDRSYRLSEAPEALPYLGEGHSRGKVVIAV